MTSVSAQKVTVTPERAGPSQNCLPATCRLPEGGTTRSNSTGPADHAITALGSGWSMAGGVRSTGVAATGAGFGSSMASARNRASFTGTSC
jgi:hypothetical protein